MTTTTKTDIFDSLTKVTDVYKLRTLNAMPLNWMRWWCKRIECMNKSRFFVSQIHTNKHFCTKFILSRAKNFVYNRVRSFIIFKYNNETNWNIVCQVILVLQVKKKESNLSITFFYFSNKNKIDWTWAKKKRNKIGSVGHAIFSSLKRNSSMHTHKIPIPISIHLKFLLQNENKLNENKQDFEINCIVFIKILVRIKMIYSTK